ncbi:DUF3500 domain-containing protein [Pseudorhodoferax sp.]|uniref:DUF3500 domain-containing protein n=1 Tax=Pseudorhodoferax sp. TaxID=1993553 RepID=UPI0039E7212C
MHALNRRPFLLLGCSALALAACGPHDKLRDDDDDEAAAAPAITVQPASVQSDGAAVELRVVATGGGLSYQWYRDEAVVAGATAARHATAVAGAWHVVVRNALGEVRSATAVVTVSPDPVIHAQPLAASVTASQLALFTVAATGVGLSYQWYRDGLALPHARGASLRTGTAGAYHVVVASDRDGAAAVASASAALTVAAAAEAPAIATPPAAQAVIAGRVAVLAVAATGTDLRYAWFQDGRAVAGADGPACVLLPATTADQGAWHVVVRNGLGEVASAPVPLTVLEAGEGGDAAAAASAANELLATLRSAQKTEAAAPDATGTVRFAATLANARAWSAASGAHHGLRLDDTLSLAQRRAAERLIAVALGPGGAALVARIRQADAVYADQWRDAAAGADRYSLALFGTPSATAAWALQVSGHQLLVNRAYNTPQAGATPMVLGARPPHWAVAASGAARLDDDAGTEGVPHAPLEAQRAAVAALVQALRASASVASAARLSDSFDALVMAPDAAGDPAYRSVSYPGGSSGRGVAHGRLDASQKAAFKAAVAAWVRTQPAELAQALLDAYLARDALAATYVAYADGAGGSPDFGPWPNAGARPSRAAGSYLRIDGPRVWIEFLVRSEGASASARVYHASVWRDKVADYGARY